MVVAIQISVLGIRLFIVTISFSGQRYPLKEALVLSNQDNYVIAPTASWEVHQDISGQTFQPLIMTLMMFKLTVAVFLHLQVKDRRDCVKMHGSSARQISQR